MKAAAYFIGGGIVFLAMVTFIMGTGQFSAVSEANAAITDQKNVLQFPLEFTFKRPAGRSSSNMFTVASMSHFDHQSIACVTCHHTWDKKGKIESCSTKGCHDNFTWKNDPTSYFRAFHSVNSDHSCRGCHMRMNNEGKANLTVSPCGNNACHPAKKS